MQWTNGSFTYTTPVCIGHFAKDGENGMDGAYTDYSYNISKNKTSKNSSTAPTDCYYSTWQDAPIATTETYPFLWMRMERKNNASDKSVRYVCVTGDKGDKGDKGDPGDNGTDGNGIASQESLFVATDKKAVATYGSVSGWSNRFPQPTEQKPYVWKCVKTTYTKKADSYSTPELVTIYQNGANGNILRNASFTDESNMEAWVTQSQYNMASGNVPKGDGGGIDTKDKLHGHNSYFDRCSGVSGTANYKDVLVQTVQHSNGGLNNIVSGLWYTLSFWAKRAVNVITLNKTVSATSYATANVYLKAGVRYAIRVQSTVSSASYPITTTVTPNGTSVAALTIKQTASGSKTDYLTPSTSGIHAIRSVVSGGTGTVISYAVDDSRDLSTYLAPSLVDTSSKIYVDGEERTPSADLGVVWSLASGWSFHTLTFKAAASLTASVKQQLFFRLDSVPHVDLWRKVWICEPKLESGMMYTGYVDSAEDLKGIPGLIERTSEWVAGVEYHNDSYLTGGIRYRDIVTVTDSKGNFEIYVCQKTHLSTTSNAPKTGADSAEWLHVNGMRPIYTPLIIADNAVLRFGQTNRMLITNSKQKVQGCFGGVENEATGYPLWIGNETAENSKYKVSYGGQLNATEVNISGNINATSGTFNNVTISSGKIAGFSISGNGLTNDPFTNDAYVVFRNDSKSCFAGIGGNVLPTSSGLRSVARFENNDDTNQWGLDKNIAMYLSAKNGTYNYAFVGSGNGILDGCICGIGFETVTNNKEKTVFVLTPTKSLFFFASDSSKNGGIGLPTLSSLRAFLGVSDTKEFCVAIEIVLIDVRSDGSFIYGRNTYIKGMDTDEYPTANWNQKKSKYGEPGSGWVDNYFIAGYNKVILHYRNGEYMATLAQSTIQTEVHST